MGKRALATMGKKQLKPRNLRRALERVRERLGESLGKNPGSVDDHAAKLMRVLQEPLQSVAPQAANQPAANTWTSAVVADRAWMNKALWSDEYGTLTRQSFADGFRQMASDNSEWAGLPVPLMGERLTIEPSYWGADKQDEINRIVNPVADGLRHVCRIDDESEQTAIRNRFWSDRLHCEVAIWQQGQRFSYTLLHTNRLDYDIKTLGCAEAWSLETEERAMETLRGLLSHQQFRQYLLTGSFLETSKRSKVIYFFRRLRPTLAISAATSRLRILAALCQHPIAYYQNSWAGAMSPSDDVLAHLMLMRGDESMYWKRSNQHHPIRPEAGL